ncbi:MAG: putative cysteine ligase BshC [Bacteroidota bacterium]|jgi:bacillithiol biosynthesis cysteine-adding enzyme BshC
MPTDCISYQESGYFSKLIVDYLDEKSELKPFYNRFPKIENFKDQIAEKQQNLPEANRQIIVAELEKQYINFDISEATQKNIHLLNSKNTFTITTGHQLNLFTGPLYFIYKIVSTINICKQLKETYPNQDFVPVYWMASEDHDFDEINYFNFKNNKIQWKKDSKGPVGRLTTSGLEELHDTFTKELGTSENAKYLIDLFTKSYLEHSNLTAATRYLANELFKEEGLVILDGDSVALKKTFVPYVKKELLHQTSFEKVTKTATQLSEYKIQVNPREINLFYIEDDLRERILLENGTYKVNNTTITFTQNEILNELENHPEKFSPNVILRPLYQEVVLPNLCYIGGGGELAYWLELKSNFEANNITFPILLLRNSVVIASTKQAAKGSKLGIRFGELFLNQQELINQKTKEASKFSIDFTKQKETLENQFKELLAIALQTDKSFIGAVKAQEAKQIKGLENLEKRLLKAEKRSHAENLKRIMDLQNELFPNQSLQERKLNFSEFYLEYGADLIQKLLSELEPLKQEFKVITF